MNDIICLVDGNNMFASCELAFRPDLIGKPVVVLSSNDACCIARSYEAKALGIKMAQPYFEVRHFEKTHGLIAFSANFTLYTDISSRIVSILEGFTPHVAPYSIDESFCRFPPLTGMDLLKLGNDIRSTILTQTGIGTGVGISTTKTLAKLANNAAKKFPKTGGVVDLVTDEKRRERLLAVMEINEVWGIGKALNKKLRAMGIITALDLAKFGESAANSQFSVTLARTVSELNGIPALPWEDDIELNDQIIATRSFGEKIFDKETVIASLSYHVSRAVKKLRLQNAVAHSITIHIRTNANSKIDKQYSNSYTCRSSTPINDVVTFTKMAKAGLDEIWRDGFPYAKSGITLNEIESKNHLQEDLFASDDNHDEKKNDMQSVIESINTRYGLGAANVGSAKSGGNWQPKSENRSPNYTTSWADIPTIKAD